MRKTNRGSMMRTFLVKRVMKARRAAKIRPTMVPPILTMRNEAEEGEEGEKDEDGEEEEEEGWRETGRNKSYKHKKLTKIISVKIKMNKE